MSLFSPKKFLLAMLIIFFLLINTPIALAACNTLLAVTLSPTELTKCAFEAILGEIGVSKEDVSRAANLTKIAEFKKPPPLVTITFAPANPIPGEKVTAVAVPINFVNQMDSLYFTWYLSNPNEGETPTDWDEYFDFIEKKKLRAMRSYASDGFDWQSTDYTDDDDADGYNAIRGGADQKGKNNLCYFYNTTSGVYAPHACDFRLFPEGAGDGTFNQAEEFNWRTNPHAPDTAGIGHPDEANVVGLGANEFSWIYQSGDKVGVGIEGTSYDATDRTDSSYKTMWAYLNGTCNDHDIKGRPSAIGQPREYSAGGSCIANCESNKEFYNRCLLENMLAPTEGGGKNEKIEVSLSFSPTNPVNDTSAEGDNADWIDVVSIIENSAKTESLDYTWNVYAGNSADTEADSWVGPLPKSQLIGVEQTVGAGIPNLKFKANFTENPPQYLKVKLNVSEVVTTAGAEGTRKGYAQVVIPLSSFDNKLSAFNTLVNDSLILSADTSTDDPREICKIITTDPENPVDAAICQVAPDEIIAVKANIITEGDEHLADYNFLWTLNNQPLSYKYLEGDPDSNYADKSFQPGNLIFFPVLDPEGTTLSLSLVATNKVSGKKISLNKTFLVSEPAFKISSTDESTAVSKILGYYIGLDGVEWPDYSQTEFSALKGSSVKISLEQFASNPLPSADDLSLKWYWDETELSDTGRTLSFTADSAIPSFSLSAKGFYSQDITKPVTERYTKNALNKYWDVPITGFYEKSLSGKVNFSVVDILVITNTSKSGQQKILASFISSVPAYFAFLFRIVMTTFVLVSAIWILFALFPQTEKNE
jgi:hypothetical protein